MPKLNILDKTAFRFSAFEKTRRGFFVIIFVVFIIGQSQKCSIKNHLIELKEESYQRLFSKLIYLPQASQRLSANSSP